MPQIKLPEVTVAGSALVARLPLGLNYDDVMFSFGGTGFVKSAVTGVQLKINSRVVQEYKDLTQLDDMNKYYARGAESGGVMGLFFRRPELQAAGPKLSTINAERLTSLGTANLATVTIEATINTGVYTAPAITAYANVQYGKARNLGLVTKVRRFPHNPAGGGLFSVDSYPRGPRILAIHGAKSDIDPITFKADGYAVVDNVSKAILQRRQSDNGRVPVSGYTVLDFAPEGNLADAFATADLQDMRFDMTLGSGGAFETVVEYLDGLAGI